MISFTDPSHLRDSVSKSDVTTISDLATTQTNPRIRGSSEMDGSDRLPKRIKRSRTYVEQLELTSNETWTSHSNAPASGPVPIDADATMSNATTASPINYFTASCDGGITLARDQVAVSRENDHSSRNQILLNPGVESLFFQQPTHHLGLRSLEDNELGMGYTELETSDSLVGNSAFASAAFTMDQTQRLVASRTKGRLILPRSNADPVHPSPSPQHLSTQTDTPHGNRTSPFVSPFTEIVGTFGVDHQSSDAFRNITFLNSYLKMRWPQKKPQEPASKPLIQQQISPSREMSEMATSLSSRDVVLLNPSSSSNPVPSPLGGRASILGTWTTPSDAYIMFTKVPAKLPPNFGLESPAMDSTDTKLFQFYLQAWCPGRSVLRESNVWLNEFARMHNHFGILAAMQSLAGIYIYDYTQAPHVRMRVIRRFAEAELRLQVLLTDPDSLRDGNEVVTITCFLAMQDVSADFLSITYHAIPGVTGLTWCRSLCIAAARGGRPIPDG
jgi:hypothetical protein